MDFESAIEFLGGVPLLQSIPSSFLEKIAQLVIVKSYEKGELVIREGEIGEGIYFILEGEAEVLGSVHPEEDSRAEFQLKRYDYFGVGSSASIQQTNVVALTELICLLLPHEHCTLLKPKSIWSADKAPDSCPLVESILLLEPIEANIFRGITLLDAPKFGKVFGGQFIGQALAAASKTVDCLKVVHSLHAYFLLLGNFDIPIIYHVDRLRDGKSFATQRVQAIQKGNVVFTLLASFQKEEHGFEHSNNAIYSRTRDELRERRLTDPHLPRTYRNKVATKNFVPWPIEIRFCEPNTNTSQTKSPSRLRFWFRAKGKLSDDKALHRCVVAYASDFMLLEVSLNPHCSRGLKTALLSLDHSMWFHRPFRTDDWILYVIESPAAHGARSFVSAQMFNRKGEHIVSLIQEGLVRRLSMPNQMVTSKL